MNEPDCSKTLRKGVESAEAGLDSEEFEIPSERRIDARHLACFPAHLETAEGLERTALIRDLSTSGAQLLTQVQLNVGDPVRLALYLLDVSLSQKPEPYSVNGRVIRQEQCTGELAYPWTKSVTVQFEKPLTEIEPLIQELAQRQATLFGRPTAK